MNRFHSLFWVCLAGTATGVYGFVHSLPGLRLMEDANTNSDIVWAFPSLATFGAFLLIANLGLVCLWILYSLTFSRISRESFLPVLQRDAFTYCPLCFLLISLLQLNSLFTSYFQGILLLSHSAGYWLLLPALLGVYHLKVRIHGQFLPVPKRRITRVPFSSPPSRRLKIAVFLISLIVYTSVGIRFERELGLGGDEPHYLLITHSILHDHDLAIRNNYRNKDYQSFFQGDLGVHVSIAKDETRYSIHPIGMPILMVPAYALYGCKGAIFWMNVLGALLALVLFLIAFSHTQNPRLSLLLWAIVSFTPPLLLYASQLYPEIPAALFLATAYYLIHSKRNAAYFGSVVLGLLLAYLPWLQQRMILPSVFLLFYHLLLLWVEKQPHFRHSSHVLPACIPTVFLLASGLLMAGYNYLLFRDPFPSAPYMSVGIRKVFSWNIFVREGLPGLLFDQEAGLLIYAPYFIFLFAGLLLLWRRDKLLLAFLMLAISSIYIPCAGFTLKWRGAWSPVARYMVAQIPLLFIPLCIGVSHITRRRDRYLLFTLVTISAAWSLFFLQSPFSAIMRNRGINVLFEKTSNLLDLPRYFPSFTPHSHGSFLLTGLWIAAIAFFAISLSSCSSPPTWQRTRSRKTFDADRQHAAKQIFLSYGILAVASGMLTFFPVEPENMRSVEQTRNWHLRTFLSHVNYRTIVRHHTSQEQPFQDQKIRFAYISHEKIGKVGRKKPGFLVTGPRDPFPRGKYTAYFNMMVAENSTEHVVAILDVVSHQGSRIYAQSSLKGSDFAADGAYQFMSLPFELLEDVDDLETRVHFQNIVTLGVQKIYIEPNMTEFYYDAGLSALSTGHAQKAESLFLRAVTASDHFWAHYQIGRIKQAAGLWEETIPLFQRLIRQQPNVADAHYRLGLAYQHTGQIEKAQQHFEAATTSLPTHLDAWKALKEMSQKTGQTKQETTVSQTLSDLYAPQHPYAINFGNQIMFMGYNADNTKPGKLVVTYYWKALNDIAHDYTFFIHFKSAKHTFQQDHLPSPFHTGPGKPELYLTSQWKIGELVREQFELDAPAGTFQIQLGVWKPETTKKRLPIISSTTSSWLWKRTTLTLQEVTIY